MRAWTRTAISLLVLLFPSLGKAQTLAPAACQQFFSASGIPLAGGFLYSYVAGTSTPTPTYADSAASIPNSNPIILNAGGFPVSATGGCGIWLASATSYKFVVQNSTHTAQWTVDNISAVNASVLLSMANTWTGLQTFNAGITSAGPNTISGTTGISGTSTITGSSTLTNPCAIDGFLYVSGAGCYATAQSAISALPATGGTIYIPPGTYACPSNLTNISNIQLIATTYQFPSASLHALNSSWLNFGDQKVVFDCSSTWTIDSVNGLVIKGITIQTVSPQTGDAVLLKAVTNSYFEGFSIGGQGSGQTGYGLHILGQGTSGTNSSNNTFQDFIIAGFNTGSIFLNGTSASANCVTLNEFRNYWLTSGSSPSTNAAIQLGYCVDSNYWYNGTLANLGNSQPGLTVNNTGNASTDEDSGGNAFFGLTAQPAAPSSYTASLFNFNQSQGTLIDGASISGGLTNGINSAIGIAGGSPQFRVCFASNFTSQSYSNQCVDQTALSVVNATSQSASIGTTTLYAVPANGAGFYRVYGEAYTASTGSGSVVVTVSSNIGGFTVGQSTSSMSLASNTGQSFSFDVYAAASTNISYQTTYSSTGSYNLKIRLEYHPQGN